jgi:ankyrin repeat protein
VNILQYMLDNNANVNFEYSDEKRNISRETPLIAAAKNGLTETVRALINHGDKNYAVKNNSLYYLDNELLVRAEKFLRLRAPKRLKADVNKTDSKGYTPLMLAAKNNHIDIVRVLLIHSADVDKSLQYQGIRGYTALMLASKYGYIKVADILIKKSADIDKSNYQGYTALLLASRYGHTEIVEILINNSADPNIRTHAGLTPLYVSSKHGHIKIVKILVNHLADPNLSSYSFGKTPLMLASKYGYIEISELLINNSADVHKKAYEGGYTALSCASKTGQLKIVEILINKPERVFGLQVRCRELDIFKIRNFLRNCLKKFIIFSGFLGGIFWIFLGFFLEDFFGGFFWEEFFGRIFFGRIFLGGFF